MIPAAVSITQIGAIAILVVVVFAALMVLLDRSS